MILNFKLLNPLGFHLLKYMQDPSIRHIIMYGGSSAGKTYSFAQMGLIFTMWEGSNLLVLRKVQATIKDTVYQDFKTAADQLGIANRFKFTDGLKTITCLSNKARIVFKGLDDSEKIKGLSSFKRVFLDEWSEFDEGDHKQIRLRLRGMEGQQIIYAFNPIKETHFIKRKVFDTQKWHDIPMSVTICGEEVPAELTQVKSIKMNEPRVMIHKRTGEVIEHSPDTVVIQTTYLNNFWVVGSPDGKYGYYDEQCIATFDFYKEHDPDYYNVYALGEWGVIRSGSEFFGSFNRGKHVDAVSYDPALPVHLSIDSNVLPYISVTLWQIAIDGDRHDIRQIGEICAGSPDNTVRKAARLAAARLHELGADKIILHGDASTRAANNIDDEKRSFHDLFIDTLQKEGIEVEDKVSNRNPSVAMTGEFINAIYEGILPELSITIDENCHTSIEDYLSVQKDANGAILKTKVKNKITMQTYEEHGHISDCKRYLVADVLHEQFYEFSNRRKRNAYARNGAIHFYNPATAYSYSRDVVYAMPNIGGKFAMVHGKLCGDKWHIVDAVLRETSSTDEIKQTLIGAGSPQTIIECAPAYFRFVRELRKELTGVRALEEAGDLDRRIAATVDFVKNHILFNEREFSEGVCYPAFMAGLLDYSKGSENREASAVLSGFIQFVVKFGFSDETGVTGEPTDS
ncbi:MAG: PBSX family phage terminase large subunit [Muribaculaceae bacterium]